MKKAFIITASILLAVGIVAIVTALALGGANEDIKEVTYTVNGEFNKVVIESSSADISIEKSESGKAYAICEETEHIKFSLKEENGTLILKEEVKSLLAYLGFNFKTRRCALYLPESEYSMLTAKSSSGNITSVENGIEFEKSTLISSSGNIYLSSPVKNELSCKSSSGKIKIESISPSSIILTNASGAIDAQSISYCSELEATSSSGSIKLSHISTDRLSLNSSSGALSLTNVKAKVKLSAKTSSGKIDLKLCDADELILESSSGNISGTLLSDKNFSVSTSSGNAKYPSSVKDAGNCTVKTSSGNIEIEIAE